MILREPSPIVACVFSTILCQAVTRVIVTPDSYQVRDLTLSMIQPM